MRRLAGAAASVPLWLAACATTSQPEQAPLASPAQWQAPLPHNGNLTDLTQWWQQQGDPVLVQLIEAAQAASPSISTAKSRIDQARAARTIAGAALLPALDGSVSASRGNTQPPQPLATTVQAGLQASWEVDLFGANRATRDAAQARLEGAQAQWHEARVSVSAEVANQYVALRTCERQLEVTRADTASRGETARLADLAARAGFQAPASAALARASAAEGKARQTQQQAQCDLDVKALVALTALPEPDLRKKVSAVPGIQAPFAPIAIANMPAQVLAQRPDLFQAEREVAAASAELGSAQAQRYPRLGLNGSIGALHMRSGGVNTDLTTWSIGPLSLSVPLFDGGRRAANVEAARSRYEEAAASYQARARQAVREVEEAMVNLESTALRNEDAQVATEGFRASFNATQSRYQNGLASLVELEDTRRTALAAEMALVALQRERQAAWVALYRAAGGGWASTAAATAKP
ncbi:MAG TPA: efflux transporter outer membrane subunit [Burkholderiaceae bacterium]|nr:efflux transporter outer membrane subunit [Burkholderiaceae bacterium]